MIEDFGKVLTNIGLAGVGLAAIAVEQAGKAGKILVEKGAVAVEEGRKYGAELQEKYQQDAQRRREEQWTPISVRPFAAAWLSWTSWNRRLQKRRKN